MPRTRDELHERAYRAAERYAPQDVVDELEDEREIRTDGGASTDGIDRGIYLAADTPRTFAPLALEDGGGDKELLADALEGILTDDELEELVRSLQTGKHQNGGGS
ncbi:hypothetical protein [Natronorubrum daqingense]|nr:hypothetical protein [Natronorubrum daqingense]APX98733.1 hypothetical protein BB347_18685 [Natronorubrum daqingense]